MYPCPIHRRLLHSLHRLFPRKKSPGFFAKRLGWNHGPRKSWEMYGKVHSIQWLINVDHHFPKTATKMGGFWELNHVKNPCFQTNGMVDSNYDAR